MIMRGYPNFILINLLYCHGVLWSDHKGYKFQNKFQDLNKCI